MRIAMRQDAASGEIEAAPAGIRGVP